mgnify:CR=1 FL=1
MRDEPPSSWQAWRNAAKCDEIDAGIRSLYDDLAAVVAERRPVCNASGRCCKFEAYGHRLYVTGLEITWFLGGVSGKNQEASKDLASSNQSLSLTQLAPAPNCPYQINGLCSTHTIRPLGCRAFFCEEGTEAWQQDTTEHFLERLKKLHLEHDLPYAYMEWRAGLAEAGRVLGDSL